MVSNNKLVSVGVHYLTMSQINKRISATTLNPVHIFRKKSKLLNALILKSLISSFFSIFLISNSIKKNTHRLHAIKILVTRKTPESSIQILFTMYVPTDAK